LIKGKGKKGMGLPNLKLKVIIHADGVSRGNPGLAAIGATIKDGRGQLLASVSQRIGRATNNQAEYRALMAALKETVKMGATEASIYLDSELVVRQLSGRYRVKNAALKSLYHEVSRLLSRLSSFSLNHVPRQQNAEADRLANNALK
jgi:ribonuclease HI